MKVRVGAVLVVAGVAIGVAGMLVIDAARGPEYRLPPHRTLEPTSAQKLGLRIVNDRIQVHTDLAPTGIGWVSQFALADVDDLLHPPATDLDEVNPGFPVYDTATSKHVVGYSYDGSTVKPERVTNEVLVEERRAQDAEVHTSPP